MNTRQPMATLLGAGIVSLLTLSVGIGAMATPDQAPADAPKFEVASIKRNISGDGRVMLGIQRGGRFTATNVPLRLLITNAYRIQDFQIDGAPGWMATDRFDIVAKADGDIPEPQLQLMVQALLAERFKLAVHRDTKEMPIYALVLARPDGKLGPKLKPSTVDCEALRAQGRNSAPPAPPAPGAMMPCGMRMGPGALTGSAMSMAQFSRSLSNAVRRVVVDQTGLTGGYDFDLAFTPEQMQGGGAAGGLGGPAGGPAIDPNGPSIYTALQEQLGLKLDSQRGPVETLVIDHVEAPTVD